MKEKLGVLEHYYKTERRYNVDVACPFHKNPNLERNLLGEKYARAGCDVLCGAFPMLGDIRRGCPCEIFGPELALYILGVMLKQKNLL
jgi:hypothetical protein